MPRARFRLAAHLAVALGLSAATMLPLPVAAQVNPYVYNGDDASPGEFPFMVAMVVNGSPDAYLGQYCGGSLVDAEWVLTAAHCVTGPAPDLGEFHVIIGRNRLTGGGGQKRGVAEIIVHPQYVQTQQYVDYDIALLRLKQPSSQPTIKLASSTQRDLWQANDYVTVIGWGRWENTNPDFPDKLQKAKVKIVGDTACKGWWLITNDLHVCAGGYVRGACVGDSGGPLIVAASNGWRQVGVVSYGGEVCGFDDADGFPPDVYGQVGTYPLKQWIQQTIP